ncbi:membrane dipeptidase [Sphingobium sp. BHU LFT2]|uniref:dipeptidase n=1 Tax=Sphingobium sp. BHU LFT2 TaxID=2807634 RepID=UPI001BEA49F3|nr:membrane dipeptidase [Sphingobium sp. BHU LFT2]MBT2245965.1 membrane dipeptidase [Sphingobium sp. BHU LFT2]
MKIPMARGAAIALALGVAALAGLPAGATEDAGAIHAAILPFDAHVDIAPDFDSAANPASGDTTGQFDLPKIQRGGLKGAAVAVFVGQEAETPAYLVQARAAAEAQDATIHNFVRHYPQQVEQALTPADVHRIAAAGKFALVESIVNGGAFIDRVEDVDLWASRGARIFGFVHAGHNRLADSSRPALVRAEGASRNGGLSPLGKAVVVRLNSLGILIDVSQLSDAAFADVLALSKAPVVASHSDVRALVDNGRNLTDAQLDALGKNGGVVAINAFSAYLRPRDPAFTAKLEALKAEYGLKGDSSAALPLEKAKEYDRRYHELRASEPKANVDDLVKAIDHAVQRIGIDHVALSSDFNHGGGIIGWADEGEAGNVTAALVSHGYTKAQIGKLWSDNLLRVWGEAQALGR